MLEVVEGMKGAGKTVYMTYRGYLAYRQNKPVFANYHLEFPYEPINLDTFVNHPDVLRDATVLVDEAHNYFDAREFMSKKNQKFNKFAVQVRKRRVEVILSSQQYENIDIRIRKNTDVVSECHPYRLVMINGKKSLRPCLLSEIEHHNVDMILIKKTLIWANSKVQWIKFDPRHYFNMFDSDEFMEIV
jgi:hypothetical protein